MASAREPMIGAMRLIWWRDALVELDRSAPPPEPLLTAIVDGVLPLGVDGAALAAIEEGWAALLPSAEPDEEAMLAHARARGGRLFEASAALLGASGAAVTEAGEGWALADLGHRLSDPTARRAARERARTRLAAVPIATWPRRLRPLGLLVLMARRDAAMPADLLRRQGAPGRVARAIVFGLTGR